MKIIIKVLFCKLRLNITILKIRKNAIIFTAEFSIKSANVLLVICIFNVAGSC